jgi:hypothetical protein
MEDKFMNQGEKDIAVTKFILENSGPAENTYPTIFDLVRKKISETNSDCCSQPLRTKKEWIMGSERIKNPFDILGGYVIKYMLLTECSKCSKNYTKYTAIKEPSQEEVMAVQTGLNEIKERFFG